MNALNESLESLILAYQLRAGIMDCELAALRLVGDNENFFASCYFYA